MSNQTSDFYVAETFDEYLEHYGILGMKWGIRRTPEQLGHRVSKARERFEKYSARAAEAGEAGNKKKFNKYTNKAEKTYKKEVRLNKDLEKALKRQVEMDEKIINKGNIDEVLAISHRLSDQQIDRAVKRLQNQQKIEGLKATDAAKVDRLVESGKKIASITNSVANIASNVRLFKQAAEGIKMDSVKAEREEAEYQENERQKKRAKELDKIVREADLNKVMKVKEELSTNQMDEVFKRLYYNNKETVDMSRVSKDQNLKERWSYLSGYSNARK